MPEHSRTGSPSHSLCPGQRPRLGRVELICGCMFSGKTRQLLERIRSKPPESVAVFKHARDIRYSQDRIVSHDSDSFPAQTVTTAGEIPTLLNQRHRVVAIDEGHFFDDSLADICQALAQRGMTVLVTALDKTSWGRPFAVIERLRVVADDTQVACGRCGRCGQTARFTQRLTPISNGNIVGGPEAFEPRCQDCWTAPPEPPVD